LHKLYKMITNADIISNITNTLKLNNKDERLSKRYILSVLRSVTKFLISQKLLDRTLHREINLFSKIDCFDFNKSEVINCPLIEFRRCNVLMKSVNKLPNPIFSRLGASIYEITSLDGNIELILTSLPQYRKNKVRKYFSDKETYIYLDTDGYMYIPDKEIYSVSITLLTLETELLDECSSCKKEDCKSYLEKEFICPDKLLDVVVKETVQRIGIPRNIVQDENPNNVERG